jgi:hypothetical protein
VAQTLGAIVGKQLYRRVAEFAATLIGIGLAALLYAGSVAAVYPRFSCRADPAMSRYVADAVVSAVGLIFDRAMAGWDVSVVLDADSERDIDDRPIRILGARVTNMPTGPQRPQMLAVAADVIVKSDAVRRQVLAAGNDAATAVLLWGGGHPPSLNCKYIPVRHRPSAAAHVFKSHALTAGGAMTAQPADEGFFSMA